ncbi:MAG: HAMP domain-containing sensor histidine kinase [Clostridia bacterium]
MIEKLKKKLILLNVVLISVVLLSALTVIFLRAYEKFDSDSNIKMHMAMDITPIDAGTNDSFVFNDVLTPDMLILLVNEPNSKCTIFRSNDCQVDCSEESITELLSIILKADSNAGISVFRQQRYLKKTLNNGLVKIVVLDTSNQQNSIFSFALTSVIVTISGLVAYFAISYFLAHIALQPIEESWHKQKQFVADASHELKTPLSVILANTEILSSHQEETVASQMKWIDNTKIEAQRMSELISNMLFLTKSDSGVVYEKCRTNFTDCVEEIVLTHDAVMYEQHKTFTYTADKDVFVYGNGAQLKQVVAILVDNATNYSLSDGYIYLSMKKNENNAILKVTNNSDQISPEKLKHIFDRFYVVDASRSREKGGAGLGLSIAKVICEQHNGKIACESNATETTFTVTLPLYREQSRKQKTLPPKSTEL